MKPIKRTIVRLLGFILFVGWIRLAVYLNSYILSSLVLQVISSIIVFSWFVLGTYGMMADLPLTQEERENIENQKEQEMIETLKERGYTVSKSNTSTS